MAEVDAASYCHEIFPPYAREPKRADVQLVRMKKNANTYCEKGDSKRSPINPATMCLSMTIPACTIPRTDLSQGYRRHALAIFEPLVQPRTRKNGYRSFPETSHLSRRTGSQMNRVSLL
jgi:hypothetical protein